MKRIDATEAAEAFEAMLYAGSHKLERESSEPDFAQGQDDIDSTYIAAFAHSHALSLLNRL